MSRSNLTVHTGALVTKVIIEGGQATGVSSLHHGEPRDPVDAVVSAVS